MVLWRLIRSSVGARQASDLIRRARRPQAWPGPDVRPHDIDILTAEGGRGAPAEVRYLTAAGPVGRIELALAGHSDVIEAELSRARLRELAPRAGSKVRIRARAARIVPAPAAAFESSSI